MAIDLRLHPQTALLMLVDALMSMPKAHRLELYVENQSVGGVVWQLNDDQQSGTFLFADSDLAKLLSKFMQYVQTAEGSITPEAQQQPSEPVVQGEPSTVAEAVKSDVMTEEHDEVVHAADATGMP